MAEDQEAPKEFEYTDRVLRNLAKGISAERLAPYYVQARKDLWVAIRLYERNTRLSEALYGVVQGLEILLRNAIHTKLTERLGREDWYETLQLVEAERKRDREGQESHRGPHCQGHTGQGCSRAEFRLLGKAIFGTVREGTLGKTPTAHFRAIHAAEALA
jgi:hypothetical protein